MKKIFLVSALIFGSAGALSGCVFDQITGATISPQAVQAADSGIDAAISAATAYIELPLCGQTQSAVCHTAAGHQALKKDIAAVQTARNAVKALLRSNNGGSIPVASYDTLSTAVSTLEADTAIYAQ